MSLGERPRGSARPTPNEHYNSLPRTSIEGALDRRYAKWRPARRSYLLERTLRWIATPTGPPFCGCCLVIGGTVRSIMQRNARAASTLWTRP